MPRGEQTSDIWWRNGLVYALDVETYLDSDGDGVGDFPGLADRLDHLADLGVTCLWLLPFFPTPNRDDGYDISGFYSVDPRLGTLGDFVDFRRAAGERGMRVVIDLVFNHTSDQHPWFLSARSSRESPYHDWYIWSEEPHPEATVEVFPGDQEGNWAWVPEVGQYYMHTFYPFQPDLNFANPRVREEMQRIVGFWLELGVSGFRIDAAPFLVETVGLHGPPKTRHHEWLRELHDMITRRRGDAVTLAEANVTPDELGSYFGHGDEMTILFNYMTNAGLMLALVREDARPLTRLLRQLPPRPDACGWMEFVRNHDELNLERLSKEERDEVMDAFAPDPDMRMWSRGIRRRLPPMLGDDRRRIELAYSLTFSLPDMPMLYYGEEIGMGDDLDAKGRLSVRTPMQWSAEPNGGFSAAPSGRLVRPTISSGPFSYRNVNVEEQLRDGGSLLRWMRRLVRVRRQCPEIGFGEWTVLEEVEPQVVGLSYSGREGRLTALHNMSATTATVSIPPHDLPLQEVLLIAHGSRIDLESGEAQLGPYGYVWHRAAQRPHLRWEATG